MYLRKEESQINNTRKKLDWRKLDNSAKIFPIASSKKFSTVFRISAVLSEKVDEIVLQKAVEKALEVFKSFKVRVKSGFFWYYLEENTKNVRIEKENYYPCKYIDPNINAGYLFKVTYFENKINLDVFHALTDGNSAMHFLKEIVYSYIELKHPKEFYNTNRKERKVIYNTEDSYIKNYNKKTKGNASKQKAYILRGRKLPLGAISVTHEIIDLNKLKQICKERNCTVTQFLTAILAYSIYEENYKKYNGRKIIKICIPVNLKKYFDSITISNFFSYITAKIHIQEKMSFDYILKEVQKEFKEQLTPEEIMKTMSANVKLGNNLFVKIIPLFLKKIFVKLSYIEIRKYTTSTFSNLGRIGIIGDYKKYIEEIFILIAPESVEKIKCSSCSYENKMVFTFTSILEDKSIEKRFYELLQKEGINVKIESNGVCDVISEN